MHKEKEWHAHLPGRRANMTQIATRTLDASVHRRVLAFLNTARRPEDLMTLPQTEFPLFDHRVLHGQEDVLHEDEHRRHAGHRHDAPKTSHLLDREIAACVLEERDRISPAYGFQHIGQLDNIVALDPKFLDRLITIFSPRYRGKWEVAYDGVTTAGATPISVIHAALLHTGSVLFIADAYSANTVIWDPEDPDPATAFRLLNGSATGLTRMVGGMTVTDRLACAGHSFLSDGKLLAVGGDAPLRATAWKFNPATEQWEAAGTMANARWYPTVVSLGDDSGRVLVASGSTVSNGLTPVPEMEIYSESTNSFTRVWGPAGPGDTAADRAFPKLYPGLHLTPNGQIFHTRTGDRSGTDRSAAFTFSALDRGSWAEVTEAMSDADRMQGMSVLMLKQTPTDPDRVLVVGGSGSTTTIGVVDVPASPSSVWLSGTFPDGVGRQEVSVVLLPDGTAFIGGGRPLSGSPANGGAAMLYSPPAGVGLGTLSTMDTLQYAREHHSTALLLPSGKVMITGGSSNTIEVFSPPYLFDAVGDPIPESSRPDITSFPDPDASEIILHGSTFEIGTSNPADIQKVVMVRPMAVTHHTDTEQRVITLSPPVVIGPSTIRVTAPDGRVYPYGAGGGHTHAVAGRGYYMLFLLNTAGVPSRAKFVRLR